MRRRLPPLLVNLLLAGASLALCVLVLEGLARIEYYSRGGGKGSVNPALFLDSDPLLGWRKKPGARVVFDMREFEVEVKINSHGLRELERGYEKPPWTHRILALGDSFLFGFTADFEQTVTQQLEQRLSSPACSVEVLNGGTGAYSTDQEYLFYLKEGSRYSPDVVVLFFYFNDILHNARDRYWGRPKPLLELVDGELRIPDEPLPPTKPAWRDPGPPPAIEGFAALAWTEERLRKGAPAAHAALARLGLWPPLRKGRPDPHFLVFKRPRRRDLETEAAWTMTDAILAALARAVEAQGSRFLVAYVPSRMEVSEADWELTQRFYELDEKWERGLVAERLSAIGRAHGFPVLDLTEALRAVHHDVLARTYFLYDGHWTPHGHATAAAAVEGFLRDSGWLPTRCASRPD